MECDNMNCKNVQKFLHNRPGMPMTYICCRCNGCSNDGSPCEKVRRAARR